MRELFLAGATGRLGRTVQRVFTDQWNIHPCSLSRGEDLSKADPSDVVPSEADFVLNCAAISSRGGCISNPVTAFKLNTLWPQRLAIFSGETNRRLVHISTDLVYAGGIPPYTESSPAVPRSFYGWTKLLGDIAVQKRNPNACIVRTSILVGDAGAKMTTFSEDILSGKATNFHVDCFRNHTDINALARFLSDCLYSSRAGLILAAAPYAMSRAAYAYSLLQRDINLVPAPDDIPHDLTLRPSEVIGPL
ncbi:MAG: sugar nucleotide-binding protein [Candidatus Fermentibacteria bacterium]|nr:sugar nucleotide-binding protein [Candidatus Fermentibacteria bacterium]